MLDKRARRLIGDREVVPDGGHQLARAAMCAAVD
jgi:hypothetical protein